MKEEMTDGQTDNWTSVCEQSKQTIWLCVSIFIFWLEAVRGGTGLAVGNGSDDGAAAEVARAYC